jgi:FAD/FMN-containing dehydrogenase
MPYPDIYPPEDPSYHPMAITRTMMVDSVDRRSAATMIEHLEASDAKVRAVQIRVLGGAIARVASDSTAYAHRTRRIMLNVAAIYDNSAEAARHQAWVDGLWRALQSGEPAAYVNFLADEGVSRIHEAYPARTWDRLVAIKGKYDPTNLFRLNQNIPPAHA